MTYIAGTIQVIAPMSIVPLILYGIFVRALFAWAIYRLCSHAVRAEFAKETP